MRFGIWCDGEFGIGESLSINDQWLLASPLAEIFDSRRTKFELWNGTQGRAPSVFIGATGCVVEGASSARHAAIVKR